MTARSVYGKNRIILYNGAGYLPDPQGWYPSMPLTGNIHAGVHHFMRNRIQPTCGEVEPSDHVVVHCVHKLSTKKIVNAFVWENEGWVLENVLVFKSRWPTWLTFRWKSLMYQYASFVWISGSWYAHQRSFIGLLKQTNWGRGKVPAIIYGCWTLVLISGDFTTET